MVGDRASLWKQQSANISSRAGWHGGHLRVLCSPSSLCSRLKYEKYEPGSSASLSLSLISCSGLARIHYRRVVAMGHVPCRCDQIRPRRDRHRRPSRPSACCWCSISIDIGMPATRQRVAQQAPANPRPEIVRRETPPRWLLAPVHGLPVAAATTAPAPAPRYQPKTRSPTLIRSLARCQTANASTIGQNAHRRWDRPAQLTVQETRSDEAPEREIALNQDTD